MILIIMRIDKHIDRDNWHEIKDILPDITEIKTLDLSSMGLTELPKMSHITIKDNFYCYNNHITSFKHCPHIIKGEFWCVYNQITSFKDCPEIDGDFWCRHNKIASFKDCPEIGGHLYSDIDIFEKIHEYSKEKKISYLESQVELYNQQDEELLAHIDKFPDLVAYIRMRELNKLLCS